MQRIVCRYRKSAAAASLNHAELRGLFSDVMATAGLPIAEGRRAVVMGPPLPPGATSEAERIVLELSAPYDPTEVRRRLNRCLPDGVRIESAWIALPGGPEENPAQLDEAVYQVIWPDAPQAEEVWRRLQQFFAAARVPFTRTREKKTQELNARVLVRNARLSVLPDGQLCLRATMSVGPQGTLRPEELLTVLGYAPPVETLGIHRLALQRASWHCPLRPRRTECWRRR